MPKVIAYGPRQVGTASLPGVRRQYADETEASAGGPSAEALAGLGDMVARRGAGVVAEIWQQERERVDTTDLIAADRQLAEFELARLYDPQTGAMHQAKGKDALGVADAVGVDFDKLARTIEDGLHPRLRDTFARRREQRRDALRQELTVYESRELTRYDLAETEAAVRVAQQAAVHKAGMPLLRDQELAGAAIAADRLAELQGLGPEARQAFVGEKVSQTHVAIIKRYLANEDDQAAVTYFEQRKDEIAGDVLAELEEQVQTASTTINALRASEAFWQQFGPSSDAAPIHLDRMEEAARAQFRDDPKTLDLTIRYLRDRKAGIDAARRERSEARTGAVWEAVFQGRSLPDVSRLPDFLESSGKLQADVRDYFSREAEHRESLANTREQRAYTAALRRERELEVNGWGEYWNLSDPNTLRSMTRAQILEKFPTLGREHVTRLLTEQEQLLRSDATVRTATIDDDLFKEIASQAGLEYVYNAPANLTAPQKANLGKLRATVEAEIGRVQQAGNKVLTLEEKRALMTKLVDRKVLFDKRFWFDDNSWSWFNGTSLLDHDTGMIGAAIGDAGDQEKAYVPIGEIPPANIQEAVTFLRSTTPAFQRLTDEQIRVRAQRAIERAFAAKIMRLGPEEEMRRLQSR